MKRRGFFTTPSWSRSAVAMSLLLALFGLMLGLQLIAVALRPPSFQVGSMIFGAIGLATGAAALATGLRGVRAWQNGHQLNATWYWPGLAAGVIQGVAISGLLAVGHFFSLGPVQGNAAWMVALAMLVGGGIPFLGALCCAGAWWVERERPDGVPMPELQ